MINPTAKMKRMNAVKLTYGRDIVIYRDSKLTDKGVMKFHMLPTIAKIKVYYANGTVEEMTKANFEVLANLEKCDRFIYKHFVD